MRAVAPLSLALVALAAAAQAAPNTGSSLLPEPRSIAEPSTKGSIGLRAGAYRLSVGERLGPTPAQPASTLTPSLAWDQRKGWKRDLPYDKAHDWFMTRTEGMMLYVYSSGFLSKQAATSPFRIFGLIGDPLPIERATCRETIKADVTGCVAFNHRFVLKPGTEGFASVSTGFDPYHNRPFASIHLEWNDRYQNLGPVLLSDGRQFERLYGFSGVFDTAFCIGGLWALRGNGGPGDNGLVWREAASANCIFASDAELINDFARARALTLQSVILASDQVRLRKVQRPGACNVVTRTWRGQVISEDRTCVPGYDAYEWSSPASLRTVDQSFAAPPSGSY